jgi:hypothetical protein
MFHFLTGDSRLGGETARPVSGGGRLLEQGLYLCIYLEENPDISKMHRDLHILTGGYGGLTVPHSDTAFRV